MGTLSRRSFIARIAAGCAVAGGGARAAGPAAEPVSTGPKHHFFGYYDHSPWDATGRFLLAHEVDFIGRQPRPGEEAVLGSIDRACGGLFRPFARTAAWCWQLGSMLRWLPSAPERAVIYNVRRGDAWASEITDIFLGSTRTIPFPIYSVNPEGTLAVSLNFSRLAWTRPGYGYEGIADAGRHAPAPEDDGLFAVDLRGGTARLIVPLAALARYKPKPEFAESYHWVNHLLFSPDGSRFIFLHRWARPGGAWSTRLYTADPDGRDMALLLDHGMVSHFSWRDPRTIVVWANHPSAGARYYLLDARSGGVEVLGRDVLAQDGHMSYSPDREWLLTDTYPDKSNYRTLILFRPRDGRRIDIGRFLSPPELAGPTRCDLHPRWNRDGTAVCIDSAHEPTRQMYVVDVSRHTASG